SAGALGAGVCAAEPARSTRVAPDRATRLAAASHALLERSDRCMRISAESHVPGVAVPTRSAASLLFRSCRPCSDLAQFRTPLAHRTTELSPRSFRHSRKAEATAPGADGWDSFDLRSGFPTRSTWSRH